MSEQETQKTETPKSATLWQEYLQKCCEVGQLDHHLHNIESTRLDLEKKREVAQTASRKLARQHDEMKAIEDQKAAEAKNEASH